MIARYGNQNIRDKTHLSHIMTVVGKVVVVLQTPLTTFFD